ncbi:MAG: xanthine dehydrogenase accessory protein XdhC [Sedimentitalea sp.]
MDLVELAQTVAAQGRVMRVLVVDVKGSAPRDAGTSMLVWSAGQSGTIGGGALEFDIVSLARARLEDADAAPHVVRLALGPNLGQCCGGTVTLQLESFDAAAVQALQGRSTYMRPAQGTGQAPIRVTHLDQQMARHPGGQADFATVSGWLIEAIAPPRRPLWVWGAGHVGRALVDVFAPLPHFEINWVDTSKARFPVETGEANPIVAADPAELVQHAAPDATHLVVTYSHVIDFDICHRLLMHQFAFAGLIGSATKWARFQKRLAALGHSPARIGDLTCPIGAPDLGKHPQAIAIGVAATVLTPVVGAQREQQA